MRKKHGKERIRQKKNNKSDKKTTNHKTKIK